MAYADIPSSLSSAQIPGAQNDPQIASILAANILDPVGHLARLLSDNLFLLSIKSLAVLVKGQVFF